MADRNSKDQKKLQRDVQDAQKEFNKDSKEALKERKETFDASGSLVISRDDYESDDSNSMTLAYDSDKDSTHSLSNKDKKKKNVIERIWTYSCCWCSGGQVKVDSKVFYKS